MMQTLVRKLIRDLRWPLLTVCLLLFVFSAFWVKIAQRVTTEIAPFFNILGQAQGIGKEVFDEVIFKGPGKVSQAVLGGAEIQFERPNDFLAVELLHPVVVILTSLWAVGRASSAIAGELDRGTMELLLSQPVPRNRLVIAHFLVDLLVIPAICFSIFAGTQLGLYLIGPFDVDYRVLEKLPLQARSLVKPGPPTLDVSAVAQPYGLLNLASLMFSQSGIAMLISCYGRSRWRTTGFAALVILAMFVANVIGQLWDSAAFIRPATLFYYYQPQKIWLKSEWAVDWGEAWTTGQSLLSIPVIPALLALGISCYLLGMRHFEKRDLPAPL